MNLETKLIANFLQYEKAGEHLRRNYERFAGKQPLTREELNDFLNVGGRLSLNRSELRCLRKLQDKVVKKQRKINQVASKLDLAALRLETEAERRQFATEVPKGALLHVHPTGTRSVKTVRQILCELDPQINVAEDVIKLKVNGGKRGGHQSLTSEEIDQFTQFPVKKFSALDTKEQQEYVNLFFLERDKRYPFSRFDTLFLIDDIFKRQGKPYPYDPHRDLDEPKAWEITYENFAKHCEKFNVSYVEFTEDLETDTALFDKQLDDLEAFAYKWNDTITFRWNMAFKRYKEDQKNLEKFMEFITTRKGRPTDLVNGIDLLASERDAPALERAQNLYLEANKPMYDLRQTMHAGELCLENDRNPRDAILLGAERIGHGVKLKRDRLTLEYNRRIAKVGVVANVISNQMLRSHEEIKSHPFLYYLRLGIPTSLSTDNPGIFQTDIAQDYYQVITETDINYKELKQLAYNGIGMGFVQDPARTKLLTQLDERFEAFEAVWSPRVGGPAIP